MAAAVVGWVASSPAALQPVNEGATAAEVERTPDQWIAAACDTARELGVDVLLWLRRQPLSGEQRARDEAFMRDVVEPNARDEFVVLEAPVDSDAPAERLPAAVREIATWFPLSSQSGSLPVGETAASLPTVLNFARVGLFFDFALLDAGGRPFAVVGGYEPGQLAGFFERLRAARSARAARDAALACAASAGDGVARAAALRDALRSLDRWIVVRCYGDELAEAAELGDDAVKAWAAPLLHERRMALGFDAIGAVCAGQLDTIHARRLQRELTAATAPFRDVPEVMQIAACCQATADLRLAVDAKDRDAIADRLEAALDLAPQSWIAPIVRIQLHQFER